LMPSNFASKRRSADLTDLRRLKTGGKTCGSGVVVRCHWKPTGFLIFLICEICAICGLMPSNFAAKRGPQISQIYAD
jgi:hypothetical protein